MKTQSLLKSIGNFSQVSPSLSESLLVNAAKKITEEFGFSAVEEPIRYSIEEVLDKLLQIKNKELTFEQLSRKEHRLAPWALFQTYNENEKLIDSQEFVKHFLAYTKLHTGQYTAPILIHLYLLYFPVQSAVFENLRTGIKEIIASYDSNKIALLKAWTEGTLILDPGATLNFARNCMTDGVEETFNKYKLSKSLATGQFACFGLSQLLTLLSSSLSNKNENEQTEIITSLLEQLISNDELHYPTLRADIADGLLQSYNINKPSHAIKKALKEFFITFYGDIRTEKTRWIGVSEEAKQVMQQWMVENTLNDFFALLSHVSRTDSQADHHWRYRKRFWNAYLQKGVITEAWVALGPVANDQARKFLKSDKNVYASLSGAQRNHSALIMVIGD
ncbi:EH signature domain-containing protein [Thalassotalea sp. ND16A]|uniref:EH signature domain-containing protein n=1 Tax=Thalassotalea sp. ND16A TaxID=1535422 RepID=UPI00051A8B8D|nr:EH signature domain-containing protein [Thalassotalea sp. ND16A]KGJ90760.1 hypothetical protein ND16A_1841 [Thalassotalea sp. ND16A]